MAKSSITAEFDFLSYKIDTISMKMGNEIGFLMNVAPIKPDSIELSIKIRNPEKFFTKGKIIYIGGLMTHVKIIDEVSGSPMMEGQFGISGLFTTKGLSEEQAEETFVKVNLPALLMPHLRATMTNILSNAGFGTTLFPLINVYELAKNQNLEIIDHTKKVDTPPSLQ